jgi:hypothetical protein
MTLQNVGNFFENLKTKTTKKYEIEVYEKFLHILTGLKRREFSKEEIQSIETELDNLDLKSNPKNKKRYFNKALSKFEIYLKDTYSLTTKEHYADLYSSLGLSYGVLFGVALLSNLDCSLGISIGLTVGMFIGLAIGRQKDMEAKARGEML